MKCVRRRCLLSQGQEIMCFPKPVGRCTHYPNFPHPVVFFFPTFNSSPRRTRSNRYSIRIPLRTRNNSKELPNCFVLLVYAFSKQVDM